MTTRPIYRYLKDARLPLASIHLDPNNPRFAEPNSKVVQPHRIAVEAVQEQVRQRLVRAFKIDKIRANIEINGFLPMDRVTVRKFKPGCYVVLEGNRRVCAAKMVDHYRDDGTAVSDEVRRSLVKIPCLIYTGKERDAALIFQGLRHFSGVLQWQPFSKARLLVEQREKEGLSYAELAKKFETSVLSVRHWVFSYYGFMQAQESSDYAGVIDVKAFPYFQEVFSNSGRPIQAWLGWDENTLEFKNRANLNEFIGWLYPKADGDGQGDFNSRLLPRTLDVRDLTKLIRNDPQVFKKFRRDRDIDKARSRARTRRDRQKGKAAADQFEQALDAIMLCTRVLKNSPYRLAKDERSKTRLRKELDSLRKALAAVSEEGERADGVHGETPIVRH